MRDLDRPHLGAAYQDTKKPMPFVFDKDDSKANWELIEPMLLRSVEISQGTTSIENLKEYLFNGSATLFGTKRGDNIECIAVATIVGYATYQVARILALAGKNYAGLFRYFHVLEAWAVSLGAVEIEGWCQPGMVRLHRKFGGKPKFTIVSYDLRRKLQ